ncbi:purple acid phosphatase family protein [Adhaeribacter aquaticus]|uniref:purple acid phosphatase family protein n=1 Tax=Adhaeribacter aquaticus TaxID=299567 RepID=UPI000420365A|nr:metallophosphoesterase family protein [Adhaeribacter aquaticus]
MVKVSRLFIKVITISFICFLFKTQALNAQKQDLTNFIAPTEVAPGLKPDRIILTWQTDPSTSQTVTWRTSTVVKTPVAEILPIGSSSATKTFKAKTQKLKSENSGTLFHAVNFTNLQPNTQYQYRVGDGTNWSNWFRFETANDQPEPFSFIYLGDAQNELATSWAKTVQATHTKAPQAKFVLHIGDQVNSPESETEWQDWFTAGAAIFTTKSHLVIPGNHEYARKLGLPKLTRFWNPQFNFPKNGPKGFKDVAYYTDYQDVRIITLNSYWFIYGQAHWLEEVLRSNTKKWTIVACHYPVFSASRAKDTKSLIKYWKPLFDKYKVDLVLQGHDHTYARGFGLTSKGEKQYVNTSPVYVVSISGPKAYRRNVQKPWPTRTSQQGQLFQVISFEENKLLYKSYSVSDALIDAFELTKAKDGTKAIKELLPLNTTN